MGNGGNDEGGSGGGGSSSSGENGCAASAHDSVDLQMLRVRDKVRLRRTTHDQTVVCVFNSVETCCMVGGGRGARQVMRRAELR